MSYFTCGHTSFDAVDHANCVALPGKRPTEDEQTTAADVTIKEEAPKPAPKKKEEAEKPFPVGKKETK